MPSQTHRVASALLAVVIASADLHAQAGSPQARRDATAPESHWLWRGELGAVIGGAWLAGATSPSVTTGAGVALALDARRRVSPYADVGAAIRVVSQPLRLREMETEWDGGTLTDAQLLATTAITVWRGGQLTTAFEFGGGLALLSGAKSLYPFSSAGQVSAAAEAGVSIQRGDVPGQVASVRPISVFVRYGLVRVDPGPTPATALEAMTASTGWVGRTTIGVKVQR